jgi:chemotaxis protein MotA
MKARHESNQNVVKAWIDIAPAMGMIGTLVGLVLMLGNMADPKAIGPAMAVCSFNNIVWSIYSKRFIFTNDNVSRRIYGI